MSISIGELGRDGSEPDSESGTWQSSSIGPGGLETDPVTLTGALYYGNANGFDFDEDAPKGSATAIGAGTPVLSIRILSFSFLTCLAIPGSSAGDIVVVERVDEFLR